MKEKIVFIILLAILLVGCNSQLSTPASILVAEASVTASKSPTTEIPTITTLPLTATNTPQPTQTQEPDRLVNKQDGQEFISNRYGFSIIFPVDMEMHTTFSDNNALIAGYLPQKHLDDGGDILPWIEVIVRNQENGCSSKLKELVDEPTEEKQETLSNRLKSFWGFGNYESKYWFIGMEEGGGDNIQEVSQRLSVWERSGSPELIDNFEYHKGISGYGYENHFEGKIKLQPTWAKLIRTYLNIENPNKNYSADNIKQFQAKHWGRLDSNNCLLDIFPLPSPTANNWYYDKWCEMPLLRTREIYKNALQAERVDTLQRRVSTYKPKVVMFYAFGNEYLKMWERVAGINFTAKNNYKIFRDKSVYLSKRDESLFVVTYQPSAVWNNEYWNNVGRFIYRQL